MSREIQEMFRGLFYVRNRSPITTNYLNTFLLLYHHTVSHKDNEKLEYICDTLNVHWSNIAFFENGNAHSREEEFMLSAIAVNNNLRDHLQRLHCP